MQEFTRGIVASGLKSVQAEMLGELTKLQDAFLRLKSEMQILEERWKGEAADEFKMTFFIGWSDMWQEIQALAKVINKLGSVESEAENTEKQVLDMLKTGGLFTGWMD